MKEWEDRPRKGEIKSSEIRFGAFRLIVHRYVGCGDTWFASCHGLFGMADMESKNLPEAKSQAKAKLQAILEDAIRDLTTGL